MNWKSNWQETQRHFLDWWDHKGLVLGMWGNGFAGTQPLHDNVALPPPAPNLETYHTDPEYVARWAMLNGKDKLVKDFDFLEPNYLKEFIVKEKKL